MNSTHKNDILPRIAQGDESAIADCIDEYFGFIWRLARKSMPNHQDAEDAAQEIFLEIWQNAGRFAAEKASETTFVAIIARRRLIDRLRKIYRQPRFEIICDVPEVQRNSFENEIHSRIGANEIIAAMNLVHPEQRELIMLNILGEMTHFEIAEKANLPLGTVKTRIRRGLKNVRQIMNKNSLQEVVAA